MLDPSTTESSLKNNPDDEYQKWVQKFYNEFDKEKYAYFIILPFVTVIIILVNSFVLFLFYHERASIKTAHKYIISMSVNDLLVGLSLILMEFSFFDVSTFLSENACVANSTIGYFIIMNSLMTLLISSADRYWSIAFPVHYKMQMNHKAPNYILIGCWSLSIIIALISLAFTRGVDPQDGICRYNPIYATIVGAAIPAVCLLTIILLYILIYRTLKEKVFSPNIFGHQNIFMQIIQYLKKYWDEDETKHDKKINKEVKTTLILFLTVTAAFAIMIPTFCIYAIFKIWPDTLSNSTFYSCVFLFLLQPIVNPLLYVYCISNIRKRGKYILRKLCLCNEQTTPSKNELESSQKITPSTVV